MPVYIGDYLADTMHLTTEQHGAYLLLLFHLWRRGSLPADEASLARIAGLGSDAWSSARGVLREFFEIDCEGWHHRRVERERERIARKQESNSQRARSAALGRWQRSGPARSACDPHNDAEENAGGPEESNAASNPSSTPASIRFRMQQAVLHEGKSESESESQSESELELEGVPELDLSAEAGKAGDSFAASLLLASSDANLSANSLPYSSPRRSGQKLPRRPGKKSEQRLPDPRHVRFRGILAEYWAYKNPRTPEMPWLGRDAKALSELLQACPALNEEQFRQLLRNRARSAVAHGDRIYLWIANLTRYQEEIGIYNKPVAGGANVSRAEINCNSVTRAVERALDIAQRQWPSGADADGAGQVGAKQTALLDGRVPVADGPRSGGLALAGAGAGDHRVEEGDFADGASGADGSFPHGAPVADSGGAAGVGDAMRPNNFSTIATMDRRSAGE